MRVHGWNWLLLAAGLMVALVHLNPTPLRAQGVTAATEAESWTRDQGFSLSAKIVYGLPFGGITTEEDLDSFVTNAVVPLWLEGGFRFDEENVLGAYFNYGFPTETCDDGDPIDQGAIILYPHQSNCSTSMIGYGVYYAHNFGTLAKGEWTPWLGLAAGFETISSEGDMSITAESVETGETATATGKIEQDIKGFNLLQFSAGADYAVAKQFAIGPVLVFGVGKYDKHRTQVEFDDPEIPGMSESGKIDDATYHEWLYLGVRATFN